LPTDDATTLFYEIVWPLRADVVRFAQFLCKDAVTAEDIAQETLLKAFRALGRAHDRTGNQKAWLFAILRNAWRDRLRKRQSEVRFEDLADEPSAAEIGTEAVEYWNDPQALLNGFSDRQMIDALQALPDEIRWTLLLVDVEGVGLQEAAEILDVPLGTIKSRAHRGRSMLRQALLPLVRKMRRLDEPSPVAGFVQPEEL